MPLFLSLIFLTGVNGGAKAYVKRDLECINSIFETKISHGGWPWGLIKKHLTISKDKCLIVIGHEKFKFIKKRWAIDVCREPVHIKYGIHSIEVFKRKFNCLNRKEEEDEFCVKLNDLKRILQDDGLIFAKGEKEELTSDHGKVYCSYLLIQTYLQDGIVSNRRKNHHRKATETEMEMEAEEITDEATKATEEGRREGREEREGNNKTGDF